VKAIWDKLSVCVLLFTLIVGGAVAWGQTTQRVDSIEKKQAGIERSVEATREIAQQNLATVRALDERSTRILETIERIERRLEARNRRYGG